MNKKKLNTSAIVNELRGQSVFFQGKKEKIKPDNKPAKVPTGLRDTTQPRHHDTVVSRYHDTIIEKVRKAVKQFGKEAATHRFTQEEKDAIADIVYSNKLLGIRTSENEITRIAINFITNDRLENKQNSVLDQVLKALNE